MRDFDFGDDDRPQRRRCRDEDGWTAGQVVGVFVKLVFGIIGGILLGLIGLRLLAPVLFGN